ncbi:MFS transporter [Shewanella intestini]|uniref:CynX/NimT family MFS transporter n=1 Tax=Shewanella intestini TaxID=2017544 RepID=A0ABS5I3K6_9GAMM|nr:MULTISPECIES: MFS transporter [Shewanella]MBR9727960.1 CynX/NimT family MFS transporter [Shewanella intestini]MRG36489.1 MFS transporter [Shewanella sp. XMDDZSB0408]
MSSSRVTGRFSLLFAILLIAVCLRSPITGVGPVLSLIRDSLNLTATQAGMLTTLPLLAFAFFSPLASIISRRRGLEQSLMLSLILMVLGLALRSLGSVLSLYLGTVIIGAGIAIANVLLPSLIKRDYPNHIATLTSVYVLMMGIGAALSAGFALPLSDLADSLKIQFISNWAFSLICLIILPIAAIFIWLPQMSKCSVLPKDTATFDSHSYLWRNKDAWQISLFLALNSFLMYIFISWLPTILIDQGYSHHQAGVIHGVFQLCSSIPAIILIPVMAKVKNKQLLALGLTVPGFLAIIAMVYIPHYCVYWVMLLALGIGGAFVLALTVINLRTQTTHQAATLSGMVQSLAYLFSATGPVSLGAIHQYSGNWHKPLLLCAVLAFFWCVFAVLASTNHPIEPY